MSKFFFRKGGGAVPVEKGRVLACPKTEFCAYCSAEQKLVRLRQLEVESSAHLKWPGPTLVRLSFCHQTKQIARTLQRNNQLPHVSAVQPGSSECAWVSEWTVS